MAMLMAVRIVENKYDYRRVPRLLVPQVDECLESLGFKIVNGKPVPLDAE